MRAARATEGAAESSVSRLPPRHRAEPGEKLIRSDMQKNPPPPLRGSTQMALAICVGGWLRNQNSTKPFRVFPHPSLMRPAIGWSKSREHPAPAHWADVAFDQNAAFGKLKVRAGAAAVVAVRVVLILRRGLRQFLLLLRLVFLRFDSRCTAAGCCCGGDTHCLDELSPRRSGIRHGCFSHLSWVKHVPRTAPAREITEGLRLSGT